MTIANLFKIFQILMYTEFRYSLQMFILLLGMPDTNKSLVFFYFLAFYCMCY